MIIPIILSGGSGSRLWPLSRKSYPKQFLSLVSAEETMIQATLVRGVQISSHCPIVICNEDHRFLAAEQIREANVSNADILLEPLSHNTAPAITLAALHALSHEASPDPILLVMPADHFISDARKFAAYIEEGTKAANAGKIVCFGIQPVYPETGYGYIQKGAALTSIADNTFDVKAFTEKPDQDVAESYIRSDEFCWNSGIFMFKASVFIDELTKYEPELVETCRTSLEQATTDLDFIRIDAESFAKVKDISIDYALMERTQNAAVIPMNIEWSDIGSWSALWQLKDQCPNGNVCVGDVITDQVSNSYIHSTSRLVTAVGVQDVVIVETKDAVMVAAKDKVQDVKNIVAKLKEQNRREQNDHREVYRPWGKYDSVDQGARYQVKRITVKPGEKLSVQMHHHRAEHWIVVSGTAKVTIGEKTILLGENQSTYIPLGEVHALENPGKIPLELIEVQSGSYLGEDDIVRFEDRYGRSPL
ncbi:mannose-1-phosphate guanylyltransferase/mannose-6-phosphate isomerase [Thalassospira mesophila]|uniref:mannose-1-phosphate guanylyltransferase/mannose-6-phosphate isomerase n=1 Tax=Thalassospira mesophila TaxID=1293891 RepID=UPI00146F99FA|nr:mannose-1-phosphate guanylyltransferase/mannose-6-phosphate isomerase [Thalassospira mesophila]